MRTVLEPAGYATVIAGVTVVMIMVGDRWLPASVARRTRLAWALALAYLAGYGLRGSSVAWIPAQNWHFSPYLAMVAAVTGPLAISRGVWFVERWMLAALVSIPAAFVLVPDWESIQPMRHVYVAGVAAYLFALIALISPLADRVPPRRLLFLLVLVAATAAGVVLASVSVLFGQLIGVVIAAMAGCWIAAGKQCDAASVRGLVPVFALLVGGLSFVASIYPDPAIWGILVLPAAPLAVWATRIYSSPKGGWVETLVQAVAVSAVLAAVAGWILLRN
jgi:hypothetical protein